MIAMSSQDEVNEIANMLRKTVASAIDEKQFEKIAIEITEIKRIGTLFMVSASFRTSPFLGGRTGKISVTLNKSNAGFQIEYFKLNEDKLM
jgi:hypothetical protein